MSPEPNDYAGIDYPLPGDPGWDIDRWDDTVTTPIEVTQP